jgi:Restriction endonuclease
MRGDWSAFVVILGICFGIAVLVAWSSSKEGTKLRAQLSKLRDDLSRSRAELMDAQKAYQRETAETKRTFVEVGAKKDFLIQGLTKIIEERKIQFPWLASAFADLNVLVAERDAKHLETKRHPAERAAEEVRKHAVARREAEKQFRIARYRVDYYEKLFPWIVDYVGDDVPDYAVDLSNAEQEADDPASRWLTPAEYQKLSSAEKYQKALDNWRKRKKSNWDIGRDYERYVGYLYETMGYDVRFSGAIDGFEDMGRDVIAKRGSELAVVQCKYWSSEKIIREKHIFQLFGSALEYAFRMDILTPKSQKSFFENPTKVPGVTPVIYTSTKLSDVAKDVAATLGVQCNELAKISEYPLIKCNVSMRDGEKIYHLPFDQQYDRVKILGPPEKYTYTVLEAEQAGFRRAWRWRQEANPS